MPQIKKQCVVRSRNWMICRLLGARNALTFEYHAYVSHDQALRRQFEIADAAILDAVNIIKQMPLQLDEANYFEGN